MKDNTSGVVVQLPGAASAPAPEPEASVKAIPPKTSPEPPAAQVAPEEAIRELRVMLAQPDDKLADQTARLLSLGKATGLDLPTKLSRARLLKRWRKVPELAADPKAAPAAEAKPAPAAEAKPAPAPAAEAKPAPPAEAEGKAKLRVHKLTDEERARFREEAKQRAAAQIAATARRKAVRRRLDEIGRSLITVASRNGCLLSMQIDPEDPKEPICLGIYEWAEPEGGKGDPHAVLLVEAHGADLGGCLANALRAFKKLDAEEGDEP